MNSSPSTGLVIIASYNEKENIVRLLESILSLEESLSVLIVDDNSPDGTADEIRQHFESEPRVMLLCREKKAGYGTAMVAGFNKALEDNFETVVTMDADLSHDPESIPQLLGALRQGADMVIGSRYKDGVRVLNWPPGRLLISLFGNWYVRRILGLPFRDSTSGFRAYRRKVLEQVDPGSLGFKGYAFLVELLYRAFILRFQIVESPIIYTERREGQSKMSKWVILESAVAPWRMRLRRGKWERRSSRVKSSGT